MRLDIGSIRDIAMYMKTDTRLDQLQFRIVYESQ